MVRKLEKGSYVILDGDPNNAYKVIAIDEMPKGKMFAVYKWGAFGHTRQLHTHHEDEIVAVYSLLEILEVHGINVHAFDRLYSARQPQITGTEEEIRALREWLRG